MLYRLALSPRRIRGASRDVSRARLVSGVAMIVPFPNLRGLRSPMMYTYQSLTIAPARSTQSPTGHQFIRGIGLTSRLRFEDKVILVLYHFIGTAIRR